MKGKSISLIYIILFGITVLVSTGCSKKIYPESSKYALFNVDNKIIQIWLEPFAIDIQNTKSKGVIIPITFWLRTSNNFEEWPRRFLITKVRINGVDKKHTQIAALDNNSWIYNNTEKYTMDELIIPVDIMPNVFNISIWFKDNNGKRYCVKFFNVQVENLQ